MITKRVAVLNRHGVLEFISLYMNIFGSEKLFKFPVVEGVAQPVAHYSRIYGPVLAQELVVYANEVIQDENFDDII